MVSKFRPSAARGRQAFDHGLPIARPNLAPVAGVIGIAALIFASSHGTASHAIMINLFSSIPPEAAAPPNTSMEVLEIGVTPSGQPTLQGVIVTHAQLKRKLKQATISRNPTGIVFQPNAKARYADALPILGAIKAHGLIGGHFCFGKLRDHGDVTKSWRNQKQFLTLTDPPPETSEYQGLTPRRDNLDWLDCDPRRSPALPF